jgi:hypothetical protein
MNMSEQRKTHTSDEIRSLIAQMDRQLRQAELLRSYIDERSRQNDFWPERRRVPRIPDLSNDSPT